MDPARKRNTTTFRAANSRKSDASQILNDVHLPGCASFLFGTAMLVVHGGQRRPGSVMPSSQSSDSFHSSLPRNQISAPAVLMSGLFTSVGMDKSRSTFSREDPGHPDRASLETGLGTREDGSLLANGQRISLLMLSLGYASLAPISARCRNPDRAQLDPDVRQLHG
jgi:hypothetical protein